MSCDVNLFSGQVTHERVDFDVASLVPFSLSRVYISSQLQTSVFGYGWSANIEKIAFADGDVFRLVDGFEGETIIAKGTRDVSGGAEIALYGARLIVKSISGTVEEYVRLGTTADSFYLVRVTDSHGNAVDYDYEGGVLTKVRFPEGTLLRFSYSARRQVQTVTLEPKPPHITGSLVRYQYDAAGDLVSVVDARGMSDRYEYSNHLLVAHENRNGGTTHYVYDNIGRCVGTWQDNGRLIRYIRYDTLRHETTVTDGLGRITLNRFDESGRIIEQVRASGASVSVAYTPSGSIAAMTDAFGSLTESVEIRPDINETIEHEPSGETIVSAFDERGNLIRTGYEPNEPIRFSYDEHGARTGIVHPGGGTWRFAYSEDGYLMAATGPTGYTVNLHRSPQGDRIVAEDAHGVLEALDLDALGNLHSYTDGAGRQTILEYDGASNVVAEVRPDGRRFTFGRDGEGELTSERSPVGQLRLFEHERFGEVARELELHGVESAFEYDAEYNLVRVINGNGDYCQLTYDVDDNVVARRHFDGMLDRYRYDERGRVIEIVEANALVTNIAYDLGDRIIARSFDDGTEQTLAWDSAGNMTDLRQETLGGANAGTTGISFAYNSLGYITEESHDGIAIERLYDDCGRLARITDSWGGSTDYSYHDRGGMSGIQVFGRRFDIEWDPGGVLSGVRFPNGCREMFAPDQCGRWQRRVVTDAAGRTILGREWAYDGADRVVRSRDSVSGERRIEYDQYGRLTSVRSDSGEILEYYAFDANSNLARSHRGEAEIAPGDRTVAFGGMRFKYDERGCRYSTERQGQEQRFSWDADQQLRSIVGVDGELARYEYDLINRRLSKTVNGQSQRYLYDDWRLRAQGQGDSRSWFIHLPGLDLPLAQVVDDAWYFFAHDVNGVVTDVIDERGDVVCSLRSEVFGAAWTASGSLSHIAPPFRFPGQLFDPESELHYNGFRYYDPLTASYVSRDPLFLVASTNHYIYPRDPIAYIDPDGLMELTFECKDTPKFKWDACAKWAAQQRVRAMNRALAKRSLRKCKTHCRDTTGTKGKQRDYYNDKCGGNAPPTHDVDHFIELQMGGADKCCANLVAMPSAVNQVGMRTAVGNMLKSVNKVIPKGSKVSMVGCSLGKGKCSKADRKKMIIRPPKRHCKEPQAIKC